MSVNTGSFQHTSHHHQSHHHRPHHLSPAVSQQKAHVVPIEPKINTLADTKESALFTGTSPQGKGAFEVNGQRFGHAYWAAGSGFMNDPVQRQDLKEYVQAAQDAGKIAPVVVYGLGDSNGGSAQPVKSYQDYIQSISEAVGDANAELYFEPDITGLHQEKLTDPMISDAIRFLKNNNPNASILLDASHSKWREDLSQNLEAYHQLQAAGVDGFVGNVSNYRPTEELAQWMHQQLYSEFGDTMRYAIDTSRNGALEIPPAVLAGEWADVEGAGLGEKSGGSLNFEGMTLEFRQIKSAMEADVTPEPGATVSAERLQSLFQNSIHALLNI